MCFTALQFQLMKKQEALQIGLDWLLSMQNTDGGWGAFDVNQTREIVNKFAVCRSQGVPRSVHLRDIAGRIVEFSCKPTLVSIRAHAKLSTAHSPTFGHAKRALVGGGLDGASTTCTELGQYLLRWPPLVTTKNDPRIKRAADWLEAVQREDGGWSESPESYRTHGRFEPYKVSTASQTSWALMGLIAAGRARSESARRGAAYLMTTMNEKHTWDERHFTGTGFPVHFYIRYHGYRAYFPVIALARYFQAVGSN